MRTKVRIETVILRHLLFDEEYTRKVLPFISRDYFTSQSERILFDEVKEFVEKYNNLPTKEALQIEIDNRSNLREEEFKLVNELLTEITEVNEETDKQWLIDTTEKYCQEKAVYNAVMDSIHILDGKDTSHDKGHIPKLLQDALAVAFDTNVGHDFIEDSAERFAFYHTKEDKIPFDLDMMNKITKGGLSRKSLNIALAGTGVGKSLFMCHCAASNLMLGKNVLYITMEMAEEKIAERIDANLMNVSLNDLYEIPEQLYQTKIDKIQGSTTGKLIVKEYPTASASVNHFRHLLNELALKRNFVPEIIYIDYLNICSSSRIRMGGTVNSYSLVKSIAEELRGLAVEYNVPIVSATQTTRSGYTSSDIGLEDTSESFGLPATADFMFAMISTEEMESLNQVMIKQLKNRYNDPTMNKRFVIGIDRSKMRLYDVEQTAQDDIIDSGQDVPVFDRAMSEKAKEFTGWTV